VDRQIDSMHRVKLAYLSRLVTMTETRLSVCSISDFLVSRFMGWPERVVLYELVRRVDILYKKDMAEGANPSMAMTGGRPFQSPGWKPEAFVLDVDGVMTTGQFLYSEKGKIYKVFGPDDADALGLLKPFLSIHFVSADKRGFEITRKRIETDMRFPLALVGAKERVSWITSAFRADRTVFMGDGIVDAVVFPHVGYSICPANGFSRTRQAADFVTETSGGCGAVAEACVHLLERFFRPFVPTRPWD
jgi:3-deoxy-D-manno-octulosonate 8-phosphate phosphatase (KDO 8-P phosphatase)